MATKQFFNSKLNAYVKIRTFKTKRAKIIAVKEKNPTEPYKNVPMG